MVTQLPDGTTEFRFYRPGAHQVTLAGDFNGWHRTSLPMKKDMDGWWRYQLRLTPGYYHFRYVADGEWHTDYAAFGLDHGPFGLNSVVKVEAVDAAERRIRQTLVRFPNTRTDEADSLSRLDRTGQPADDWSVDDTTEELAAVGT
jgi:1,4-alpha-glucan branching enzyme